jgi:hypothetical protein
MISLKLNNMLAFFFPEAYIIDDLPWIRKIIARPKLIARFVTLGISHGPSDFK